MARKSIKQRVAAVHPTHPIRDVVHIDAIKTILKSKVDPTEYALFILGINFGLRISDLLRLKFKDVEAIHIDEAFQFRESKTGKVRVLVVNKEVHGAVRRLRAHFPNAAPETFLFRCYGKKTPITRMTAYIWVKKWCKLVGITYPVGSHTLRKTLGYQLRTRYNVGLGELHKIFGHASLSTLQRYLGITEAELRQIGTLNI